MLRVLLYVCEDPSPSCNWSGQVDRYQDCLGVGLGLGFTATFYKCCQLLRLLPASIVRCVRGAWDGTRLCYSDATVLNLSWEDGPHSHPSRRGPVLPFPHERVC